MTILYALLLSLGMISWFLIIFATVKFYRNYRKNKLVFTQNNLDSTKSS